MERQRPSHSALPIFCDPAYLCALVALTAAYLLWVHADPDFWWQLKAGLDILQTGWLKTPDPYSFTNGGEWIDHEWLAQAIFASAYTAGGWAGLIALRGFIVCVWVYLLLRLFSIISEFKLLNIMLVMLLLDPLAGFGGMQPSIFSFAALLLVFSVIEEVRRGKYSYAFFLPALFLVWGNLHGVFAFGGVFSILSLFEIWLRNRRKEIAPILVRTFFLAAALTVAATLVNPWGIGLIRYIGTELQTKHEHLADWMPLSGPEFINYWLLFSVTLVCAFSARRVDSFTELALLVLTGVATTRTRRVLPLFALFCAVVFLRSFIYCMKRKPEIWNASAAAFLRKPVMLWLALGIITLHSIWSFTRTYQESGFDLRIEHRFYPEGVVEFLKKRGGEGRIALPLPWGGYIIWHLGPAYKVSMDGRNVTFYRQEAVNDNINGIIEGDLETFLRGIDADLLLVSAEGKLRDAAAASPRWKSIYADATSALFALKKKP